MATLFKAHNSKTPLVEKETIPGYTLEIECVDRDAWHGHLGLFADASMFQTWSYGSISRGEENLSHLILKKGKKVVAAAQSIIYTIPQLGAGIAYINWGPMWVLKGAQPDINIYQTMLQALRHEYVTKRGLVLRINPHVSHAQHPLVPLKCYLEGFSLGSHLAPYRTFIVDLKSSEEMLLKGLTHRARNHLSRASKRDFEIIHGTDDGLFSIFLDLYKQTLDRKGFAVLISTDDFREVQKDLPEEYKMRIMVCNYEDKPCSALVCSHMGDMGINMLSANSNYMIEHNLGSSYVLFWQMALWLKENNYTLYDLGGMNPFENPGTYRFKKNFTGTNGNPAWNIGKFDCWGNSVLYTGIRIGDFFRSTYESTKKALKR